MTDPSPIWRRRPGADGLVPATPAPAVDLGDNLWSSAGLSNSYMMRTSEGRIVVNWDGVDRAELDVADRIKTTSTEAVAELKTLGLTPVLLTGDARSGCLHA